MQTKFFNRQVRKEEHIYRVHAPFEDRAEVEWFFQEAITNNPKFESLEISSCKLTSEYFNVILNTLKKSKDD